MKRILLILVLCLCLGGCGVFSDGRYTWETSHPIEVSPGSSLDITAADYDQLYRALCRLTESGTEKGTIFVTDYDQQTLDADIGRAAAQVRSTEPIAAYAVETITWELGTSGSKPALAVQIAYVHDRAQIRKIKHVADNDQAAVAIGAALASCEAGIVLQVERYEEMDMVQLVEDYALQQPQYVMETPQVSVSVYPESGQSRVVELKFIYQTSRDALKNMQSQVEPLFSSAVLFVSGEGAPMEKYAHLYSFLMNRFAYQLETSITPTYHLLRHGVGDSKAFAMVYSAMCRQAGLKCQIVSGTREGESWYWNIICDDEVYYHVDLLACKNVGQLTPWGDGDMTGYVWDFSAYPACGAPEEIPEENE